VVHQVNVVTDNFAVINVLKGGVSRFSGNGDLFCFFNSFKQIGAESRRAKRQVEISTGKEKRFSFMACSNKDI
jgi:hypothetical protein